ncbi:MAG TPA: glycoside hydrolase family 15 protein [Clostridiales bacterium]|nr:glycoside hydrolase family 15 protein [Clostridiales bacterium]
MLGCLSDRGELVRLFWPNIDYPQHIEKFKTGIFFTDRRYSTLWLDEDGWECKQYYMGYTNILMTEYYNESVGITVKQKDFVLPDRDVLVRLYEIENNRDKWENRGANPDSKSCELGFIAYSSFVSNNQDLRGALFDFENEALVHYRHGYYFSIFSQRFVHKFQLGNNPLEAARSTELYGGDSTGMMPDGALSWKLGEINPGGRKSLAVFICASQSLKQLNKLTSAIRNSDVECEFEKVKKYWNDFVAGAKHVNTGNEEIDNLYKRSLLVFKLMADKNTGGLLAAPEIDEHFTKCGRYAYCWGRDAAFITGALDRCGLTETVDKFYEWALNTQDENGSWHQRYHMDGNLAPSWGLQIDETGTLIWGILQHYYVTRESGFLGKMWESVEKAVDFLVSFIDEETGLPKPSFDLWEERFGEHTYSSAAVYGGISAGSEIAKILGVSWKIIENWEKTAASIKYSVIKNLWKEEYGRFLRSIRTKLNPWGEEYTNDRILIQVNDKGFCKDVTPEDGTIDVSLLGVCVPFNMLGIDDAMAASTVEAVEKHLAYSGCGGIGRYQYDNYIGGNPWVIATLWVALYHVRKGNLQRAGEYLEWAVSSRTELDLLPEQVDKNTGKPAWVIPLTWSHAMFVLLLFELIEAGYFSG